jgi:hypothetical protein
MFTFTTLISSPRSSAMRSSTGDTARQGPHHSAQKSTMTATSLEMTSSSNVDSVTAAAILFLSVEAFLALSNERASRSLPENGRYDSRS